MNTDLDCAVVLKSRLDMLKNWRDIVRSVDVFVSKPIYTYDQNGKCTRFAQSENIILIGMQAYKPSSCTSKYLPIRYQRIHSINYMPLHYDPNGLTYPYVDV